MSTIYHSFTEMDLGGDENGELVKKSKKFRHSIQVGKNIGKVRWIESQSQILGSDSLPMEYFVVGSCGYLEDEVSLWQFNIQGSKDDRKSEVRVLHRYPITSGNITDMIALSSDSFALTTSHGAVSVFKIIQSPPDENCTLEDTQTHIQLVSSIKLHKFHRGNLQCPATGIAFSGASMGSVVSVGESGSIYEISHATNKIVQSLEFVDPLTLYTVKYVGRSTIATGNGGGQVKIWDLRIGTPRAPLQTLNHLNELSGAISIAQHPTQSHVLLVGYESGSMDLWDIRQGSNSEPTANLAAEEGAASEIYFHGLNPDNFFTCSQNGEMNHWFPSEADGNSDLVQNNDYDMDLNIEFLKHGLSCKNLYSSSFPINSMNLSRSNRVICGGDSGIIYCSEVAL